MCVNIPYHTVIVYHNSPSWAVHDLSITYLLICHKACVRAMQGWAKLKEKKAAAIIIHAAARMYLLRRRFKNMISKVGDFHFKNNSSVLCST